MDYPTHPPRVLPVSPAPLRRIAIWGAGGHAKVVASAIRLQAEFDIIGFIDDTAPERRGEIFCGAPLLGGREAMAGLRAGGVCLIIAVGNNGARLSIAAEMQAIGFEFPSVIHPGAMVCAGCLVGPGTFVGAGAVVNPDARVGAHVIINTHAVVEHDGTVDDGAHVGPCACLAGHVQVGRAAWIGAGAVVRDRVSVGDGATVGMGAVVVRSVPSGVVAYGNPARVIGKTVEE